jgi:hypothetical protein
MIGRTSLKPAVAALAGRRIDALDADDTRFPLTNTGYVARKLRYRFRQEHVERLVCSAACGADILALEAAEELAIPATIVLPFAPHIFREISVTDRLGDWGERFDRLVAAARGRGDLVDLGFAANNKNAFTETNDRIVQTAQVLEFKRKLAFVVWEGRSRGESDSTAEFLCIALSFGFEKRSVLTKRRN